MKNIITTITALLLSVFAVAQNQITVSGTVLTTDGTPVEDLQVNINTDSLVSGGFLSAVALTDENGDYSATLNLDEADSQGWVYARVSNCDQNFLFGDGSWDPANIEVVIDFTYCDIQTSCQAYAFPDWQSNTIVSTMIGAPPFTYLWNTGATSSSIGIDPNQNFYSVTITDAQGCEASASYWYEGEVDSCSVEINAAQNGTVLEAVVSGATGSITYTWNTGAATAAIQNVEPGNYCVTVTSANGCSSTDCFFVADPAAAFTIDGYVYLPDSINGGSMEGWVYLIVHDNEEGTLTAVDTTEMESFGFGGGAYYQFDEQPAGDYLIKAALAPDTDGYEEHLPTYYGNVLWWNEAGTVTLPFNGWGTFNFTLTPGDNPGGPGFIEGFVADGANLQPGEIEVRDDEPLEGVSIILLDEQENPVAYTYTDANGSFIFPSLAYGTYKVVIEHLGYGQQHYWVTLSTENPGAEGLYFEVGEEGITSTDELAAKAGMTLFPNPAVSTLQVILSEVQGQGTIQVWNTHGQVVLSRTNVELGANATALDISTLPTGLYYLQIATNGQRLTQKWMKQ